jgi:hypothetical protein
LGRGGEQGVVVEHLDFVDFDNDYIDEELLSLN